jgi:selenocysteine lyase/cysteine desulfurase
MANASVDFLAAHPEYGATQRVDELRASDYSRIDAQRQVYLDYTGASLAADSQMRRHLALLEAHVFGNPHSASPASAATTSLVERARRHVLEWFRAERDYVAVFTLNASAALKLVGESYPFGPGSRLLMSADNHNSVNGIREFACAKGADVAYVPLTYPELRIDQGHLTLSLVDGGGSRSRGGPHRLFAFPAQSNFSGVRHPLELVTLAHTAGWDVLLDAAAYVPTSRLDLRTVKPEFVAVSFYKMFGYPTGVGCLLIRRDALPRLHRPWFAGGTVNFATVQGRKHLLSSGEAGFEDGTLNFLSIPAVPIGFAQLTSVGLDAIAIRMRCLTEWLLQHLVAMRHSNGRPMVRIYGPVTTEMRGGTVTLNFYDPDGHLVDYRRVEELAGERRISLRTGCFCNPGAGETAEWITEDDIEAAVAGGSDMNLPRFLQFITHRGGKSAGAIRISLGIVSNFADVQTFLDFAAQFRDQTKLTIGEATFDIESCRVIRDGS